MHSAAVYTDFNGLAKLRTQARQDSPDAKREVARQFEALFVQMMLKSMRQAGLHEGLFDNAQSEMYSELHDQQLAVTLAGKTGMGLADAIYRQLGGNDSAQTATSLWAKPARPLQSAPMSTAKTAWESPHAFIRDLYPVAEQAGESLQIHPHGIMAVAALESGWGRHVMRDAAGNSSFNLFGIKADSGWQGRKVAAQTLEFEHGAMQRKREWFRAYNEPMDSVNDFVAFLQSHPRYATALRDAQQPERFAEALQTAGYATDPDYATKLQAILRGDVLNETISSLKTGAETPLW